MKILVTGSMGFVGRNLVAELRNQGYAEICEFDMGMEPSLLEGYCRDAGFVFNLAGVNRPPQESDFMAGNFGFASELLELLKTHRNPCPVMISSSTQALLDNAYGRSKKAAEDLLLDYSRETGAKVLIYRFPNIFGKWSRPNYNSAVATFCSNAANGLPLTVNDPDVMLDLVYIDDVVEELVRAIRGNPTRSGDYCSVPVSYRRRVGDIAELALSFKTDRESLMIPDLGDDFIRKLYATYVSYLPKDGFGYSLDMKSDSRGSFTEFIKTADRGQVSVNITKPGITRGNHWHHTKNEKFLAVSGRGIIRLRMIGGGEILEYPVSGNRLEAVDIPPGYTHQLVNLGDGDLVVVMWASEPFDPEKPDTFCQEV